MGALKVHQEMALAKYERMNALDKRRVNMQLDELARQKGFSNAREIYDQKPYIWKQMCADTISRLFP